MYFDASYRRANFSAVSGAEDHRFRTDGGVAGAAWQNRAWAAGLDLRYEKTDGKLDAIGSKADVKSLQPTAFLQHATDAFFWNTSAGFSRDDYKLSRRVVFAGFDQIAAASPAGRRVDLSVIGGYRARAGAWQLTPNVGVLHSTWKLDTFSEAGAAGANLTFSNWSNRSSRGRLGIDVRRPTRTGHFALGASVLWWHEFSDDRSFTTGFVGAGAGYLGPGRPAPRDLTQGKIAIGADVIRNAVLSLSVEGLWGRAMETMPNFSAGLAWRF